MSKSNDKTKSNYESMMQRVRERATELRSDPKYDARKEREIDDLYNQYIPPYAIQGNNSLIDIAERDAYINAFPPLGSQKKGGIVIKKTIRSAIGWYMQFVTQQISTFGSGVARALRSMNNDIEELKKNSVSGSENEFLFSMELAPNSEKLTEVLSEVFKISSDKPIVVADALEVSSIVEIQKSSRVIIVDPNSLAVEKIDSALDVRQESLGTFLGASLPNIFSGAILSGRVECVDPKIRYGYIKCLSSSCIPGGTIAVVVSTNASEDQHLACEVLGTTMWSESAWEKVMSFFLDDVTVHNVDGSYVLLTGTTRAAG